MEIGWVKKPSLVRFDSLPYVKQEKREKEEINVFKTIEKLEREDRKV